MCTNNLWSDSFSSLYIFDKKWMDIKYLYERLYHDRSHNPCNKNVFFYEINFWIWKNERTLSNNQEFENVTIRTDNKKEVANEVLQIYSIKNLNYIDDNMLAGNTIHNYNILVKPSLYD